MCGFFTRIIATHAGMVSSIRSSIPYSTPSALNGMLSYHSSKLLSAASVICLSPDHLRCITTRPVSYYALFKWWLLLSQHPGCFSNKTSFLTKHIFRDLSRRSGLFPSRVRSLSPARCLPRNKLWHSEFGWVQ